MMSDVTAVPTVEYVREFHEAFGVAVREIPTADITRDERLLRARLVLEEALEFVLAMGCVPVDENGGAWSYVETHIDPSKEIDLVEAADALADLDYVVAGSALTLGIPHAAVVAEVHHSNMSKLGADGKPVYRTDGKVLKGPLFTLPDVRSVLDAAT